MTTMVDAVLTDDEAHVEYAALERWPFLHEFVSSLGHSVRDFASPVWGTELVAWVVSHIALFRVGAFVHHPRRDPAASSIFWMIRFLAKRYPSEDSAEFVQGARESILVAARDTAAVFAAEQLARS